MLKGFRYRLAPRAEQAALLASWAGVCRSVWNTGLEQRLEYRRRGAWINYVTQARQMAESKRCFAWLAGPPSDVLQQTLIDLDKACRVHGTWNVRWRSAARWHASMRLPQRKNSLAVGRLGRKTGHVRIPKLGWVRLRWSRPIIGVIRSVTVSFNAGHWWVSVLAEDGKNTPRQHRHRDTAIGIDRGVKVAAADSNNGLHDRNFVSLGEQRRMLALQRQASRQHRRSVHRASTSQRARATRSKLTKVWARIRARRHDFCHQLAHMLARDNSLIALEALRIKNMTASAKGTVEQPGGNVAQKAGLNRAILAKGWGSFEMALHHQARYTGTTIVKVNPAYTSQTCAACGHIAPESRESQAVFRCVTCGHQVHADVNAARNILAKAQALATGRDGRIPPVNNGRVSHGRNPPLVPRQPAVRSQVADAIPALQGREDVKLAPKFPFRR